MSRIRCYLDGLNFYYGIAQKINFKWIDLENLFKVILTKKYPHENIEIEKIIIFTAQIMKDNGGEARKRQKIYLDALEKHSSCIEIVWGKFKESTKKGRLIDSRADPKKKEIVSVSIREEKQTDVNLACRIVEDSFTAVKQKNFDVSCIITDDSDMMYALEAKQRLGQRIILITPRINDNYNRNRQLTNLVPKKDRISHIDEEDVINSPLPEIVGKFTRPKAKGWGIAPVTMLEYESKGK